jgi:hypothetical protein
VPDKRYIIVVYDEHGKKLFHRSRKTYDESDCSHEAAAEGWAGAAREMYLDAIHAEGRGQGWSTTHKGIKNARQAA